jgi:hypothetical protein
MVFMMLLSKVFTIILLYKIRLYYIIFINISLFYKNINVILVYYC